MNKQKIHLLGIALASGLALAQQPPLEFKGVPLGAPVADLLAARPEFECTATRCTLDPIAHAKRLCPRLPDKSSVLGLPNFQCMDKIFAVLDFGPSRVEQYHVQVLDGKIGSVAVTFYQHTFNDLASAMTQKYGSPTTDTMEPWRNRGGATFENRVLRWRRSDGHIDLRQRADTIDISSVYLASKEYVERTAVEAEAKAKASAKNL